MAVFVPNKTEDGAGILRDFILRAAVTGCFASCAAPTLGCFSSRADLQAKSLPELRWLAGRAAFYCSSCPSAVPAQCTVQGVDFEVTGISAHRRRLRRNIYLRGISTVDLASTARRMAAPGGQRTKSISCSLVLVWFSLRWELSRDL